MMTKLTALAAALGGLATALWGASMGSAVQAVLVAALGVGSVVLVHEHHANVRALTSAAVQAGAHEVIASHLAHAVHSALIQNHVGAVVVQNPADRGEPATPAAATLGPQD